MGNFWVTEVGEKKRRRQQFLREHPICCFCGGNRPATTGDHLPPRSVFLNNKWPDGYEFPACDDCNNGSSGDDALFAMISRIYGNGENGEQEEFLRLAGAFARRMPDAFRAMPLTANEVRGWMRKNGVMPPPGETYSGAPIVHVPDAVDHAILTVGRKLTQALHYKHTGKIIPLGGSIHVKWWPNIDKELGKFPADVIERALVRKPSAILNKERKPVSSQFDYRFQIEEDGNVGVYAAFFRRSFALMGVVASDAEWFPNLVEEARPALPHGARAG